eukprot:GFYU01025075.1.p1 GENE.GFYU01025075.1~~GFYU01025075.1.p1  ORF type:complete len:237 (-),score=58.87 GFYU01025075.1:227-937(-)
MGCAAGKQSGGSRADRPQDQEPMKKGHDSDHPIRFADVPTYHAKLKTGDIILTKGGASLGSKISTAVTRLVSWSNWDHVAMAVQNPEGEMCMYEATGQGVSLIEAEWSMAQAGYDEVAIRPLNKPLTAEHLKALTKFIDEFKNVPYEENVLELIGAAVKINQKESLDSVFCSELIGAAMKATGVLCREQNLTSNNLLPVHFSSEEREGDVEFVDGYALMREVHIVPPTMADFDDAK